MSERFMVDDAGTLIDKETRDTYDYVSDVCDLLNNVCNVNGRLQKDNLQLLGLLGDIRALLRLGDVDTVIDKINRFEKEFLE